MKKIDYCYHTHTKRCGHATGEDEEYVKYAIEAGLKHLGFSDHVMLPGIIQDGSRARYEMLDDYVNSINSLKERYKDVIDIKLGFEAEYCFRFVNYYKYLLASRKIDYLILGQHFDFDNSDKPTYIKFLSDDENALDNYVKHIISGIKCGLFSYVAHPDLYTLMYTKWNKECESAAHVICAEASKARIPLEINCQMYLHWKNPEHRLCYPVNQFWKIASKYKVDVVIGYDSHIPNELRDDNIDFAYNLVKKYHLNLITDFRVKKINKSQL